MDPPRHTKVRRLLSSAFTPNQITRINTQIRANAKRVVDDLAPQGEADFVTECSALLPMHNICDMMGVPEDVRRKVADEARYAGRWSDPELMGDQSPIPVCSRRWDICVRSLPTSSANAAPPEKDLLTDLVEAEVDGKSSPTTRSSPSSGCSPSLGTTPPGKAPATR